MAISSPHSWSTTQTAVRNLIEKYAAKVRFLTGELKRVMVEFKYHEQKDILDRVVEELQKGCEKDE